MNERETQTLKEQIIKATIASGGIAEDIQYFGEKALQTIGLHLAQTGIRARTSNPAFVVTPLNDIEGNMKNFDWAYVHFAKLKFNVESTDGPKIVELIPCRPGDTDVVLKEIDERGFMPAPSQYVLGLGVQHPTVIEDYGWIVSLDEQNVLQYEGGNPCFLSLRWNDKRRLVLTRCAGTWCDDWWFAVIRK